MKDCIDDGTLQSYFDGELTITVMEKVGAHLTSCLTCKRAASELENETLLLSEALEPEFSMAVPTERLRKRIDAAIAERHLLNPPRPSLATDSRNSSGGWLQSIAGLLAISPQRAFGYAGLAAVILFAITFASLRFRTTPQVNPPLVAINKPGPTAPPAAVPSVSPTLPVSVNPAPTGKPHRNQSAFLAVSYGKSKAPKEIEPSDAVKLLPGERSYLKTIAALDTTLKSGRNEPMRPGLESEYQRNLAMVDRAIAATRDAAKKNPNDPDAAEFMFAAYQNKVDLLNQVAEARLPARQQ